MFLSSWHLWVCHFSSHCGLFAISPVGWAQQTRVFGTTWTNRRCGVEHVPFPFLQYKDTKISEIVLASKIPDGRESSWVYHSPLTPALCGAPPHAALVLAPFSMATEGNTGLVQKSWHTSLPCTGENKGSEEKQHVRCKESKGSFITQVKNDDTVGLE